MMFKFCAVIAFVLNLQATTCDVDCDTFNRLSSEQLAIVSPSTIKSLAAHCGAKFCGTFYRLSDEQLRSLPSPSFIKGVATCKVDCTQLSKLSSDELRSLAPFTIERRAATCGGDCDTFSKLSKEQLKSLPPSTIESLFATCGDEFCAKFYELSYDQLKSL